MHLMNGYKALCSKPYIKGHSIIQKQGRLSSPEQQEQRTQIQRKEVVAMPTAVAPRAAPSSLLPLALAAAAVLALAVSCSATTDAPGRQTLSPLSSP